MDKAIACFFPEPKRRRKRRVSWAFILLMVFIAVIICVETYNGFSSEKDMRLSYNGEDEFDDWYEKYFSHCEKEHSFVKCAEAIGEGGE